jgi:antitoxin (DNA-binding transcriptional repressor) of toxin-antitoxin stability system
MATAAPVKVDNPAKATKSINLRQLRDTKQLKAWLAAGETVELRERDQVLARIVPKEPEKVDKQPVEWPDFAARARKIFGDRLLPGADLLLEERENSPY